MGLARGDLAGEASTAASIAGYSLGARGAATAGVGLELGVGMQL